jgi:trk system potassium uptake protein TrkA
MNVIVVGCGRVGVELALGLGGRHLVTVIDTNARAFDRLGSDFIGRTVHGEALDRDVLNRAGIEGADALAAVTTSDNVNVIVARLARDLYHLPRVVARVYNPRRNTIYEKFGLQTVASSSWGAQRMEQLLLHPGQHTLLSAGHGEVQLYEISVPGEWSGRPLSDLVPDDGARAVALVRSGRALLPERSSVLQAQDILHVSATAEGAAVLRQRVPDNGHGKE